MRRLLPFVTLAAFALIAGPEVVADEARAAAIPPPNGRTDARGTSPLPEHPRPDLERADWLNLNGEWLFRFDSDGVGERERWFESGPDSFPLRIQVPFSWGSRLSGLADQADVAWYARTIRVPDAWQAKRVFLVVGASDWKTSAWLDEQPVGSYQGGYTPFELELTKLARPGQDQRLVLRVDDTPHPFQLEGKQGYGKARGIWQTIYLEARPAVYVESCVLRADIGLKRVEARVRLSDAAPAGAAIALKVAAGGRQDPAVAEARQALRSGAREARLTLPLGESPRLWSLEDPFLYDAVLTLTAAGATDRVETYFGMRSIGVTRLPGLGHPYVALNGKPVYLQMTLDQGWHPDGFYT
jgi:beta-galactosidase/beta-glucuronidase